MKCQCGRFLLRHRRSCRARSGRETGVGSTAAGAPPRRWHRAGHGQLPETCRQRLPAAHRPERAGGSFWAPSRNNQLHHRAVVAGSTGRAGRAEPTAARTADLVNKGLTNYFHVVQTFDDAHRVPQMCSGSRSKAGGLCSLSLGGRGNVKLSLAWK